MPHHKCKTLNDIRVEITQRFSEFQAATSQLKRDGHAGDPVLFEANMNLFLSFIDPDYKFYRFDTANMTFDFPTIADIRAAYTFYATILYNGFSTHFATDLIFVPEPGSHGRLIRMHCNGGEYGSINTDFTTSPPSVPAEQTTYSDWNVLWVYKNGNWYINEYLETGNRVFRFFPPIGPYTLNYARTFPGATPEETYPPVVSPSNEQLRDAFLGKHLKQVK